MSGIGKSGKNHVKRNGEDRLTEEEVKFWIDSAKKEYFFIHDRAIKFEPQQV